MYIHLNPDRTKAFARYNPQPKRANPILGRLASDRICPSGNLANATSYNLEVADLINAFGPQAEGVPHELIHPT